MPTVSEAATHPDLLAAGAAPQPQVAASAWGLSVEQRVTVTSSAEGVLLLMSFVLTNMVRRALNQERWGKGRLTVT